MFGVGLIVGGLASPVVLWALSGIPGSLPAGLRVALLAGTGTMLALREAGAIRFGLPQAARLVPQSIFHKAPNNAARQFGFEMGTGVRTYMSASTPYLLAATLVLARPSFLDAAVAGVGFGVGRLLTPVLRAWSHDPHVWTERVASSYRQLRLQCMAVAVGFAAAIALVGMP